MTKWIDIGSLRDYPEGSHVCTTAGEKSLVIVHVDGELHALLNACPHAGQPLGLGDLDGCMLICPFHGYAFNVKTGRNVDYPYDEPPVRKYPVRVEGDTVQVRIET